MRKNISVILNDEIIITINDFYKVEPYKSLLYFYDENNNIISTFNIALLKGNLKVLTKNIYSISYFLDISKKRND